MVVTYHEIVEQDQVYAYSTARDRLDEHLKFFAQAGPDASLAERLTITFDDGHTSHHLYALPLLQKYRWRKAIFFITASWMESKPGYMSWSQLKELADAGYELQAHGWSHRFLTECSDLELEQELRLAKDTLMDRLGITVDAISVPGGSWDQRTVEACAEAGYKRIYISDPWFGRQRFGDIEVVGRLMLRRNMTARDIVRLIAAEGKPFSFPRLPYQIRQGLRRALGQKLYHRMWCLLAHDAVREEISNGYKLS